MLAKENVVLLVKNGKKFEEKTKLFRKIRRY